MEPYQAADLMTVLGAIVKELTELRRSLDGLTQAVLWRDADTVTVAEAKHVAANQSRDPARRTGVHDAQ